MRPHQVFRPLSAPQNRMALRMSREMTQTQREEIKITWTLVRPLSALASDLWLSIRHPFLAQNHQSAHSAAISSHHYHWSILRSSMTCIREISAKFGHFIMATETSNELRAQWTRPSDTFSVLLILGGDVIQIALANLTGSIITPISFSFGWVAYAITALLGAVGNSRLINCPPEISVKVINLKSHYGRDNQSWLLARLVKTYDAWMPEKVRDRDRVRTQSKEQGADTNRGSPPKDSNTKGGLCVALYTWGRDVGKPSLDWVWWSGVAVTTVQLGVAAIPFGTRGNWAIFLAVVAGTILAYTSASLPHWRKEKYQARKGGDSIALTRGQGSGHVLIVIGIKDNENVHGGYPGLNLEDLAAGRPPPAGARSICILTAVLAVLWLVLLITCQGMTSDTWYLLAVGGLGMLHNLFVAGWPRQPEAMGLPLAPYTGKNNNEPEVFVERKVMWALMELEMEYAGFGQALLREFFPGPIQNWEEQWWKDEDQDRRRGMLDKEKRDYESRIRREERG